jgi:hypothetical protein
LPEDDLRALAGIPDVGHWATVVAELEAARIFTTNVDGQAWFHNERRQFVLRECLSDDQRAEAATNAAALAWSNVTSTTDFRAIGRFAELAPFATTLLKDRPRLQAILELQDSDLAVAAALLEVGTTDAGMVADASPLLAHALRFVDDIPDPKATLGRLEAAGLVSTSSDERMTIVGAAFEAQEQALIQGRSGSALRRSAVPRVIELAFHSALRERLGVFTGAHFGIGSPSLASLGRMAAGASPYQGYVNRRDLGCNLLVRGTLLDDVSFYCAARYADEAERNQAEERLTGLDIDTAAGRLVVDDLTQHPTIAVASQRFANALMRAAGNAHRVSDTGPITLPLPEDLSDELIAEGRIRTAQLLRARSTEAEKLAFELDRGYFLAWDATENMWSECIVQSDSDRQAHASTIRTARMDDHFDSVTLRRALGLGPRDHVMSRQISAGINSRKNPVSAEASYRRERAFLYNSVQRKLLVPLDEEGLQALIEDAFLRELADARALRLELPEAIRAEEIGPRALWLVVELPSAIERDGSRGVFGTEHCEGPSTTGGDCVYVRVLGEADRKALPQSADTLTEVFPDAVRETATSAVFDIVLARLLGHRSDDIEVPWLEL